MSADILDSILNPKAPVSTGLQKVIDFVSKNRLAYDVGGKCVVGTTCGIAHVGALKPATELMQRAMAGDKKAKEWIALFKKKADRGDPWAQKVMALLDVPAMALKNYEGDSVDVGKTYVLKLADGSKKKFNSKEAMKAWVKQQGGKSVRREGAKSKPGQRQPGQRPQRGQAMQPATQQQVQQAIQRTPAQNRDALIQRMQWTQQQNLQSGMFGQPGYPAGYPQGYPGGMYGQPMGQGIPAYYGPAMSQGVPGMFATDEAFDDGTFYEEPAPGDVQFADEGADSTETSPSASMEQ